MTHEIGTRGRHGTARDFLAVIFRRRWIIATVFLVTTVTVLAINLSQPLFYESTGKVIVKRGVRDNLITNYTRTLTWEEELASEVETVKSGAVVSHAQARLDEVRKAAGVPTVRIDQKRVEASVVGESNVIAMSYQDRNPQTAVDVTDAVIHAYMDYRRSAYTLQYPKEFFETETARVGAELDDWTRKREAYLKSTGSAIVDNQTVNDASFVREQQLRLADIDRQIAEQRSVLNDMRTYLADATAAGQGQLPFLTNGNQGNDGLILELKRKLVDQRVRLREMENVYMPQSRELVQMRSQVENLENMLKSEIDNRVRLAGQELRALEATRAQIQRSMDEGQSRLASYPEKEARLSEMDSRIIALKKSYEEVTNAASKAKIAKATTPDLSVDLLTPAGKPYPKNQRDYVRLALAPLFSLIVGLGLAFFVDGLDATIKNPREAEEALELPVLASLTEQRKRRA
ncbi:MAG: GumC family protein [Candidatus Eiseniibacteriota bacterium]